MAMTPLRAVTLAGATALALLGTTAPAGATRPVAGASTVTHDEQITWQGWSGATLSAGATAGTTVTAAGLTLGTPAGTTVYKDPHTSIKRTWAYGTWTSPLTEVGFGASELVASWNADTPAGTWLQVELQGTYTTGTRTPWYVLGRWASGDADIKRTSVDRQGDRTSSILADTFAINNASAGVLLRAYQLRLTLYRDPAQTASPLVRSVGAMSSNVPDRFTVTPSAGHIAWGTELAAPATRKTSTPAITRSTAAAARPGARRPPSKWSSSTGAGSPPPPTRPGWTPATRTRRLTTPPG